MLAGCGDHSIVQAIAPDAIGDVEDNLKSQAGIYMRAEKDKPYYVTVDANGKRIKNSVSISDGEFVCGIGNVQYDISQMDAELTTTDDTTVGGNIGFTVPVDVVTIKGKAGTSKEISNTQKLDYSVWPAALDQQPDLKSLVPPSMEEIDSAPIASTLLSLRNSQIFSAMKFNPSRIDPKTGRSMANPRPQTCFYNVNPQDPTKSNNTYTLGLSITHNPSGSLTISPAFVDVTLSGEKKSITGNKLTVTFFQHDVKELQDLNDRRKKACEGTDKNPLKCISITRDIKNWLHDHETILRSSGQQKLLP